MPATIFDWVARVSMLVLAGLVTLSILGSIAALSTESGGPGGFTVDRPLIEPEQPEESNAASARPQPQPQPQEGNGTAGAVAGGGGTVAVVAPPEEKEERWLEAIAYALLALAGVGAIAVLMLWRIARELRRIGDLFLSRPPQP